MKIYRFEVNLADYSVITGHCARRSMESISVLVSGLPWRLTATVLDAADPVAVLHAADDDALRVERRADFRH